MHFRKLATVTLAAVAIAGFAAPSQAGDGSQIISFLNQTIEWRRQLITTSSQTDVPGELIFTSDNQHSADQIAEFAFRFARAEAALGVSGSDSTSATSDSGGTDINKLMNNAQAKIASIQKEIADLQAAPAKSKAERNLQQVHLNELQSELGLAQARLDTLKSFAGFMRQTITQSKGARSFTDQIDQLARSSGLTVPAPARSTRLASPPSDDNNDNTTPAASAPARSAPVSPQQQAPPAHAEASGILGMIEQSAALARKSHDIDRLITSTQALQASIRRLRDPLVSELQNTVKQGESVEQAADNADSAALAQQARELDQFTQRFKQLSAAVLPLGEQSVLLDRQLQELNQWKAFVNAANGAVLRRIGLQSAIVLVAIAVLLGFADLWKRATFRYIKDVRRRTQFLVLRRVVLGLIITFIVAFALVTQAGSLATYAGFLTAGFVVALQNIILSVVAYFFLIGRYGVHVGDRISINGVTGDVFDIGLVRLHVVEVSGDEGDQHPTGRSIVFSNSVILQPTTNFYKQLPGSDFVWHEVRLTLSPNSDLQRIETQLLSAVQRIFDTYRSRLRIDSYSMGNVSLSNPTPTSRLRFTDAGLEIVIRYPVELSHASEIDDRITRTLLEAIAQEPDVRLVPTIAPNLQPTEHPPAAKP